MKKFLAVILLLQCSIILAQARCKITGGACSINDVVPPSKTIIKKDDKVKDKTSTTQPAFNCRLGVCTPRLLIKQIYQSN